LAWSDAVHAQCDPVFAAADVGFTSQQPDTPGLVTALLWEAEPAAFAARYPDSGIIESYGAEQWPDVNCIDFWLHVDADAGECRFSVEGWNLPEIYLKATGRPASDAWAIASVFARILGVQVSDSE
jgi:hypothetical protein